MARVFALEVRYRIMLLLLSSRVGKNRDTRRESPAAAGAGRTADHLAVLFSQKVLAVRKANCIYRPVSSRLVKIQKSKCLFSNGILFTVLMLSIILSSTLFKFSLDGGSPKKIFSRV